MTAAGAPRAVKSRRPCGTDDCEKPTAARRPSGRLRLFVAHRQAARIGASFVGAALTIAMTLIGLLADDFDFVNDDDALPAALSAAFIGTIARRRACAKTRAASNSS